MKIAFLTSLLLSLVTAKFAHAGVVNGGGGKGVVCRNADGSVKSVELLDFWEARTLFGRTPHAIGTSLQEQIDQALSRLKNSYRFRGSGEVIDASGVKKRYEDQEFFEILLRNNSVAFTSADQSRVVRLRDVTLEQTNDAFEVARPRNCEFEQIVNYQRSGQILINQDLFDQMDQMNQAGLIVHEAYYQSLASVANETNSIRVRRAVGFVFHEDNQFALPPQIKNKRLYTCRSKDDVESKSVISVYDSGKTSDGLEAFSVLFNRLGGSSSLIGTSTHAALSRAATPVLARLIKQGKCSGSSIHNIHGFTFNGPVEFDRTANVGWQCANGKVSVYLESSLPGVGQQPIERLYCTKN